MEEWTRDLKNSFPSVRDTLVHILWAEWIWLSNQSQSGWLWNRIHHDIIEPRVPPLNFQLRSGNLPARESMREAIRAHEATHTTTDGSASSSERLPDISN